MAFLEALVQVVPLLKLKIWRLPHTSFSEMILADCLKLDHAATIPWLVCAQKTFITIGLSTFFYEQQENNGSSKKCVNSFFSSFGLHSRLVKHQSMTSVTCYLDLKQIDGGECYITWITNSVSRFYLIHFRWVLCIS